MGGKLKRVRIDPRTPRARSLRRAMTDAERKLWRNLRVVFPDTHFRRQSPVGPYFADFACHNGRIVIEVDGSQHMLANNVEADAARTRYLAGQGYRVLRFWSNDVLTNIDGVLIVIRDALASTVDHAPHP